MANATLSLVPTPSTLDTSTGSAYLRVSKANNPPNPPTLPSTSRRCVEASNFGRPLFTLFPRSISTPAAAYAFCFMTPVPLWGATIGKIATAVEDGKQWVESPVGHCCRKTKRGGHILNVTTPGRFNDSCSNGVEGVA